MPKIGHVHLKVSDLKKAEEFYTKIFGFKVSERVGNYLFLTFGKEHHDLALQEIRNAEHPSEDMTGLYHFAVELENLKQLANIYYKLKKYKIAFSPINHGISKALYFADPDGNGVEVYVDTRKANENHRFSWHRKSSGMRVSSLRTRSQLTGFSREREKWNGMSNFIREEDFREYMKSKD